MRLGDTNFFNLFSQVVRATNPNRDCDTWDVAGVHWQRERNVHWGANFSFSLEVHTLHHAARRGGWTLLVATEMWWPPDRRKTFRHGRWVHIIDGARNNILKWFADRERELD